MNDAESLAAGSDTLHACMAVVYRDGVILYLIDPVCGDCESLADNIRQDTPYRVRSTGRTRQVGVLVIEYADHPADDHIGLMGYLEQWLAPQQLMFTDMRQDPCCWLDDIIVLARRAGNERGGE